MRRLRQWAWAMVWGAASMSALAQLPMAGKFTFAPDDFLLSNGRAWHYRSAVAPTPRPWLPRAPTPQEAALVERAERLLASSSAKAMALIDGDEVVWTGYKAPASDKTRLLSFSVGKTLTALAVGQAVCEGRLTLDTLAREPVPELAGTDLGEASVGQLLSMSSGTWEGQSDSTIETPEQERQMIAGAFNFLDLLRTERVHTATRDWLGTPRKPGQVFAYRSTDPLLLGVMLNRTTGMSYARWIEQRVLLPAGIARPGIVGQDHAGYGASAGNIRLFLDDWVRVAQWVKATESGQGCLTDHVRAMSHTRIANSTKKHGASFDGYGYLTWTDNLQRRDSYWAVGHGGQRIGWNHRNARMLVAFSNVENYMPELYLLYRDWAALSD